MNPEIARYAELHKLYIDLPEDDARIDDTLDEMDKIWWTLTHEEQGQLAAMCVQQPDAE